MTTDDDSNTIQAGAVLGVDVGYSKRKKTTGLCLLQWSRDFVELDFKRTGTMEFDRRQDIRNLVKSTPLLAAAIDGPLGRDLRHIPNYRAAEAIFSQRELQNRGKPGQSNSPVGRNLHQHAGELARLVLEETSVGLSSHFQPVHPQCIVEAFPNMFLAAGVPEDDLPPIRRDASDKYWRVLAIQSSRLRELFSILLPGREITRLPDREIRYDLASLGDHEHRAALVCALSALSVVVKAHVGVGDADQGDMILPPRIWWASSSGATPWMERVLWQNLDIVRNRRRHPEHQKARLVLYDGEWQR